MSEERRLTLDVRDDDEHNLCFGGQVLVESAGYTYTKVLNEVNAALNAAPQAEKAREIIERAGTLLAQSKAWIYSCKKGAGAQESALADTRMGEIDQLLADIAAYKENKDA